MKYTTLLIVLIFSFLLILPASAADINEGVVSADEIVANETISENEETDVELNANETYGTYVTVKYPDLYKCIPYTSCRHTVSMIGNSPSTEQIQWLAEKYEAVSFEKWDSVIKGITKMSEKEWFRKYINIDVYDKFCVFRCDFMFWRQRTKRAIGRPIKRVLKGMIKIFKRRA